MSLYFVANANLPLMDQIKKANLLSVDCDARCVCIHHAKKKVHDMAKKGIHGIIIDVEKINPDFAKDCGCYICEDEKQDDYVRGMAASEGWWGERYNDLNDWQPWEQDELHDRHFGDLEREQEKRAKDLEAAENDNYVQSLEKHGLRDPDYTRKGGQPYRLDKSSEERQLRRKRMETKNKLELDKHNRRKKAEEEGELGELWLDRQEEMRRHREREILKNYKADEAYRRKKAEEDPDENYMSINESRNRKIADKIHEFDILVNKIINEAFEDQD